MKNVLLAGILALCVLLGGCFDFQQENSIEGKWMAVKDVYTTYERTYNPEIDQCYKANIYEFTDSLMILYRKYETRHWNDLEYCTDTLYSYTLSIDSLDLMVYNTSYPRSCAFYFTEDGQLVLNEPIKDTYFDKFQDDLPPESWVTTITSDEYEPDGNIGHASTIELNSAQSHTLTENDSDYYHINAEVGKSYLIRGLAYFDIEMYLYDQHEDLIAYDEGNDLQILGLGGETETAILWTCESDGDYYPMIKADSENSFNGGQGYYQMLVEEVDTTEIEYGDDIEIAAKKPKLDTNYLIKL